MTEEAAIQIYQLGKLLYTPQEVAVIMGMDEDEIVVQLHDPNNELYRQYYKGYYETESLLRNSILKLAAAGSSPAQNLALRMQNDNIIKRAHE